MEDVHSANKQRTASAEIEKRDLAEAAHAFFVGTPKGKLLYAELKRSSGHDLSAFSPRDNFDSHGAAFRDGMRATFLLIKKHIENHEQYNKPNSQ